jgi:hypothetical protein
MAKKPNPNKEAFLKAGMELPTCVNEGCQNKIAVREWKYFSFKSECSRCMTARKKNITTKGVTIHKKKTCENHDGHLGFKCPVDPKEWKDYQSSLDLDHLDGDHMNNVPDNVKTYCKLCHMRKGDEQGDYNSKKSSGRNLMEILGLNKKEEKQKGLFD